MQKITELTIKRSEWYRGKGGDQSHLLNADGMKCCLGFFALACGATKEQILDTTTPAGLAEKSECVVPQLTTATRKTLKHLYKHPDSVQEAMIVNDKQSPTMTEAEREAQIAALMLQLGRRSLSRSLIDDYDHPHDALLEAVPEVRRPRSASPRRAAAG